MDETEFRYCELRADPDKRMLSGTAMKYGDVANIGTFRERFERGLSAISPRRTCC